MDEELHRELMREAIGRDADGQRALLAGDTEAARAWFHEAAELYRKSWEVAPPRSYGRLLGMLKSGTLSGGGREHADYVLHALADEDGSSPALAYARALAALIVDDDGAARESALRMRAGSGAFERTANAILALVGRDQVTYAEALTAIVRDFERRDKHLTSIAIADTAVMLEELAARRGVTAGLNSPLLPGGGRTAVGSRLPKYDGAHGADEG